MTADMLNDRNALQKSAQKHLAAGKIQPAIEEYLKILRDHPNDWTLMLLVGDLYLKSGQSALAIPLFQRVAEQHCSEGFLLKAIAIYKRIHRLDPGRVETRIQLADVYLKQGLITEARFELLAAIDHYEKQRQNRDAIRLFHKLIEIVPEDVEIRSELSRIYERDGMISEAVGQHLEISSQWMKKGRVQESLSALEKARSLNPRNPAVLWKMLWIYLEQNEFEKADRMLEEFTAINPSDPEMLGLIVKSFSHPAQLESMIDLVNRALIVSSNQEELRILKGELFLRGKDVEQAFAEFVRAIQEMLQRRDYNRPIALLRRITRHSPGYHPALELLVDLYIQNGQESNLPGAYVMLADAYIARSLYLDAKQCLQKLVELEPRSRLHREKLEFVQSFLEIPESERESIQRASEDFEVEISLEETTTNPSLTLDPPDPAPPEAARKLNDSEDM